MNPTTGTGEPKNWSRRVSPAGPELFFAIRGGKGFLLSWAVAGGCLLAFGYGAWFMLEGWLIDRSEILVGGVVFFLVMLGGVAFGVYSVFRLLGSTIYLLAPDRMRVTSGFSIQRLTFEVERPRIREILRIYTPPKEAASTEPGRYSSRIRISTAELASSLLRAGQRRRPGGSVRSYPSGRMYR